jgi:hypothetical protein
MVGIMEIERRDRAVVPLPEFLERMNTLACQILASFTAICFVAISPVPENAYA